MQMYIAFVPNLTSSRVCLLPHSTILPSPSSVSKVPKEDADLYNLNKSEITAFRTEMVCFFLHSLKGTVWCIWDSENSAETVHFNSVISGVKGDGGRQTSDRRGWRSGQGRSQEGLPLVMPLGLETMTSAQIAVLWWRQLASGLGWGPRAGDTSHHLLAYLVSPVPSPFILQCI